MSIDNDTTNAAWINKVFFLAEKKKQNQKLERENKRWPKLKNLVLEVSILIIATWKTG